MSTYHKLVPHWKQVQMQTQGTTLSPKKEGSPEVGINWWQRSISICVGSLATISFLTPLEVVKTRVQAEYFYTKIKKPPSTIGMFKQILSKEGPLALYTGFSAFLLQLTPNNLAYFWLYETVRDFSNENLPGSELIAPVWAGMIARTFATYLVGPMELLKTQLQSQALPRGTTIRQALKINMDKGGFVSLWRGVAPTLWRDVPFSAIYWFSYELFKKGLRREKEADSAYERFTVSFWAGAAAGTVAGFCVTPFDVVKTLRQSNLDSNLNLNTIQTLKMLYSTQGQFSALFAGVVPRLIRVPPGCAIMISSYELTKYFFQNGSIH